MLRDSTLDQLLQEIASKSPAPGGGTVSAIAGALSGALISMVCGLTIGKKRYRQVEDEVNQICENSEKLRQEFLLLSEKDAEVFSEVMKVYGLARDTEEEINDRKVAIEEATKRAALVPMDVLRRCEQLAQLCQVVASKGNENSISDAGVAAALANAAAQGASLNILINLATISDEDFVGKLKSEQAKVLKRVKDLSEETLHVVYSKL